MEFSNERKADSKPLKSRTSDGLEVVLEISFQYRLVFPSVCLLFAHVERRTESDQTVLCALPIQ